MHVERKNRTKIVNLITLSIATYFLFCLSPLLLLPRLLLVFGNRKTSHFYECWKLTKNSKKCIIWKFISRTCPVGNLHSTLEREGEKGSLVVRKINFFFKKGMNETTTSSCCCPIERLPNSWSDNYTAVVWETYSTPRICFNLQKNEINREKRKKRVDWQREK